MYLFLFYSCHPTIYRPIGLHNEEGGYKETKIDENIYQILFYSDGHTTMENTMNSCFYRCAEFTKEKGYQFFIVLETVNLTKFISDIPSDPCFVKVIKFVSEKPENCHAAVYNADEVIKNLNPIIIRKIEEIQDTMH
jgi:hypothetical protein